MPRCARIVIKNMPHHIIQRGNRKQTVFFSAEDKNLYLNILRKQIRKFPVEIYAYCLMNNHVHLIAAPSVPSFLAKAIGETHKIYTTIINKREKWKGYLWEGRFKSFVMDESYLYKAIRYVELNPVRAGMVNRPEDYFWSSAYSHIYKTSNHILSRLRILDEITNWRDYLSGQSGEELKEMQAHVKANRPGGEPLFLKNLKNVFGNNVEKQKRGPKQLGTRTKLITDK